MKPLAQNWPILTAIVLIPVLGGTGWLFHKVRTDVEWMPEPSLIERFRDPSNQPKASTMTMGGKSYPSIATPAVGVELRVRMGRRPELIGELLQDPDGDFAVAVASMLGKFVGNPGSWPRMLDEMREYGLTHANPKVRFHVLMGIFDIHSVSSIPRKGEDLAAGLGDTDADVRRIAFEKTGEYYEVYKDETTLKLVIPHLLERLTDPDEKVRNPANGWARQLLVAGLPEEMRPVLFGALEAATDEARKESQKKMVDWWKEHGETFDFSDRTTR